MVVSWTTRSWSWHRASLISQELMIRAIVVSGQSVTRLEDLSPLSLATKFRDFSKARLRLTQLPSKMVWSERRMLRQKTKHKDLAASVMRMLMVMVSSTVMTEPGWAAQSLNLLVGWTLSLDIKDLNWRLICSCLQETRSSINPSGLLISIHHLPARRFPNAWRAPGHHQTLALLFR